MAYAKGRPPGNPPSSIMNVHGYRTADEAWRAEARGRSPRYLDANEVLEKYQRRRETVAARTLLGGALIFGACALFAADWRFHALAAAFCAVGFVITCLVSGNRSWKRAGRP